MNALDRRTWTVALVVGALVLGILPFLPILDWLPWGPDASKWISWSSLDDDGWWESVTNRKHFVGYRPVTAFSYVLNHLTTGYAPWGYRGFDLLLHGSSGILLALLVRQWTNDERPAVDVVTAGVVLVVVLMFFGHPAAEEIVPFSARRSYLLSMVFGLGGLLLFGEALRWTRALAVGAGFVGTAALLGLAVLSNESAYVLVPMVPLVGVHLSWSAPALRRIALAVAPVIGVAAIAIALRVTVLGSVSGGYYRRYFAIVNARGAPAWRELPDWQPFRILYAAWAYLLVPHEVSGARLVTSRQVKGVLVVLAIVFLLGLVAYATWRRRDAVWRAVGLAAIWLGGSTAIIVLSQTWFWRQAYWMLPPYGIVVAVALREAWLQWDTNRARALALGLPAASLALLALGHGPVLRLGMNTKTHGDKIQGSEATLTIAREVRNLEEPTDVMMVVPLRGNRSQLLRLWENRLFPESGHRFRLLAHLDRGVRLSKASPRAEARGDTLVLSDGYWLTDAYRKNATVVPADAEPGSRPIQHLDLNGLRTPRRPLVVLGVVPPLRVDLPPARPLPRGPILAPPGAVNRPVGGTTTRPSPAPGRR